MFWRVDIFRQLLRFCFDVLIVKEDTYQRTRFVGMRQRDETFIFQIQRFFTAKAGGGFDGFNGGNRGRVVLPGSLSHHAFGDGETHRGFNFTQMKRLQLRLALRLPVQVAFNSLTQNRDRAIDQFFMFNHAIDEADF